MSNKKILFQKLDQILKKMFRYSFILGDWGKYVWIIIYLGYSRSDGYSARNFAVNPNKIYKFEHQRVCNSCYEDIYVSEYDPIANKYNIYINIDIINENIKEIKELIRDIEIHSIDAYNIIRNLYLDSKGYPKLSLYFRRDISDEDKILEEINESFIFGQSISDRGSRYREQPVFRFMALKEKKKDINGDKIGLSYPNYYRFSFIIYGQ